MPHPAFRNRARTLGARPEHLSRLVRDWLGGSDLRLARVNPRHPPPRALREALGELQGLLDALVVEVVEHPSQDGSCRLLVRFADGMSAESVLLPRNGLCISTQIGCAVGCRFCKTGESGLLRQLSVAEMLAQLALARRRRPVRRVVLMGMGEPAHNLPAVLEALAWLGVEGEVPHKSLVFSTVGERRCFELLARHSVKPALALSLHTTDAALREQLLPRAPRIDPAELVGLATGYARATGHPLQVQWTLLAGVNDGEHEIAGLLRLLRGERAIVNVIPYNDVEGSGFERPPWERAVEMVRALKRGGVLATIRRSGGQDVDGGCGQLRARALAAGSP